MHPLLERRRLFRPPLPITRPALFLDRDGVLIEDRHHLCDPAQVQLCSGAKALLQQAHQRGWPVVVITNQSGIARGLFDWRAYELVTERLLELLGPAAPIAAIYANGHGPDAPAHSWRKPSPAMLQAAAVDLQLDLATSFLVGDRLCDLQAGAAAGLCWLGHISSGHGQTERPAVERWASENPHTNEDNGLVEIAYLDSLHQFPVHLLNDAG
ncbi:HAD-IIIA family hydrolase [Cyanobium sp. WAJ14-Wanaka]|uniref:D-glycero-alpha-D-manno-heptose-1,7-bisphosphate 7-phosphatase n=1 Tax=Cyanobium sp. WAJ14-Wanaka TaxID=2823725 RepID=UPI0020CDAA0C|nr:HAD-IIIA family hydrolase [Cyanobium sp. WAJ14-Wanaka]MCP9775658.1 HAD-IIIA family hydrolase [Cyanobium sp. WAJ14-Wanaka]